MDHQHFLQQAIELAKKNVSEQGGGPFGAVVVRDGEVIATGVNIVQETHDPSAHAELLAIREACRKLGRARLSDCVIYDSGEPCPMCQGVIRWADLQTVYYASSREEALRAGMAPPGKEREIPYHYIETPGALEPFELWSDRNKPE